MIFCAVQLLDAFPFPVGITSYAIGLKICTITARIKKYKSIIKKKRNMIK